MAQSKTILVTGGAGFIGSHTVVELVQAGHTVVVLDNLSNASAKVIDILEQLTGTSVPFYQGDIRDRNILRTLFAEHAIDAIMHFAGLKAVGESVSMPLAYYNNNVLGSIVLFEEAHRAGCRHIIFSSSATVYGDPAHLPIAENAPTGKTTNPYGTSKLMIEQILQDMGFADSRWQVGILRYFNPVGAHSSGLLGENPTGVPNNIMPIIVQTALGKRTHMTVFGNEYDTEDGTCIRDYIHVVDLAVGHVRALEYLFARKRDEVSAEANDEVDEADKALIVNLGTGCGSSVLGLIDTFQAVNGVAVPYRIGARRAGDVAVCYADATKAHTLLGWQAHRSMHDICQDAWRFACLTANSE